VRSVVYKFEDLAAFGRMLRDAPRELSLPAGEKLADGEWVLAIFELGAGRRATAAAGRGVDRGAGRVVVGFELRDWERLGTFAEPKREIIPSFDEPGEVTDPMLTDPSSIDVTTKSRVPAQLVAMRKPPSFSPARGDSEVSLTASGHHAVAGGARVLLVDDDQATCEIVCTMLEAVGLLVAVAKTAEEALERVRSKQFQLVVLDWNLPGMTGLDLCRQIRREPEVSTLPVLFLTGNTSQKDLVEAFASGADDYVLKPFRAPELGARIFGLIRRTRNALGASS
jgi:two-component system phosphate regulon response regulator PhoB